MNKTLEINDISGLASSDAEVRLRKCGYNELPVEKSRNFLTIALSTICEPMFLLLLAGGVTYFMLGNAKEAIMLLAFVVTIIGLTFYQEHKTEHALEKLRDLSSPRALVIRDGKETRIPCREVVAGDVFVIYEGDRVPADGKILAGNSLTVDESLLSGESVPVTKFVNAKVEDQSNLYSSTLVVNGYGICEATSTGINTRIGKIGGTLKKIIPEATPLQKQTRRLVKYFALAGLALCIAVVIINGLIHGNYINGFLAGITLAMSILPEEVPVILTVFLALGAWRIAKKHVLTRRVPSVETLGSITVLCSDKTGTITHNKMAVQQLCVDGECHNTDEKLPEGFHELVEYGILASEKDPFDPVEKAIKKLGKRYLPGMKQDHDGWQFVHQYPLSKELMALSYVWHSPERNSYEVAAKGAPEAIVDLCHLTKNEADKIFKQVKILANQGLRVLGVAKSCLASKFLITNMI